MEPSLCPKSGPPDASFCAVALQWKIKDEPSPYHQLPASNRTVPSKVLSVHRELDNVTYDVGSDLSAQTCASASPSSASTSGASGSPPSYVAEKFFSAASLGTFHTIFSTGLLLPACTFCWNKVRLHEPLMWQRRPSSMLILRAAPRPVG
ncbi:hypothetical protein BDY19DRAFT_931671 [Irpex rosettiformis]|uniref:Uncharacterized protein n=1 Tax=Irpex rosettiformis TaxID=378272 RepID=A0ACB8UBI4_9APHY|nr:hypothetical protein BDY19DRAFT_931671 [Irpex rosettiformis]